MAWALYTARNKMIIYTPHDTSSIEKAAIREAIEHELILNAECNGLDVSYQSDDYLWIDTDNEILGCYFMSIVKSHLQTVA